MNRFVSARAPAPRALPTRKTALLLALCGLALAAFVAACGKKPTGMVLATVGDRKITIEDFRKEVERRVQARRPIPDKATLLHEMVTYEAMLQRAGAAGLADDPEVRREVNNILISRLQERELTPRLEAVNVTKEEVRAEYDANLAKFTRPAQIRLALLYLEADSKASAARREEIRQRLTEARSRAIAQPARGGRGPAAFGFGALAIDYSDDQASRYRGGDIGWLEGGNFSYRWPRQVLETGYALEQGKVSEVIETDNGFYLVRKTDSRAAVTTPFAELEPTLRQSLLLKKRRDLNEAYQREATQMAGTTINQQGLASVELPRRKSGGAQSRASGVPPTAPGMSASAHEN